MTNFWQKLKKPIIGLAPMSGITDEPMRLVQAEISKPDVMFTEFVNVTGFQVKPEYFLKILSYEESERPVIAQIFGSVPNEFYHTAKKIINLGFDGIDINMGCPARTVFDRGGGAALIGNFKLTEKIISAVLQAVNESKREVAISVKTRISESRIKTLEWINFLGELPIHEICVHGRIISQRSAGTVNWELIGEASKIPKNKGKVFLGNGGIRSKPEAVEKCMRFGLDGVLIGQAALGNPWAFLEGLKPGKTEILNIIENHAKMAWQFYGKADFIKVRKHFGWYPKYFSRSKELRTKLIRTQDLDQAIRIIDEYRDSISS